MIKVYNKLVRDRIPEIIEAGGNKCTIEILSKEDYIAKLEKKLDEELKEFLESKEIEELADLVEVVRALLDIRNMSWDQLEKIRKEKFDRRGGFSKAILLKEVISI